MIKRTCLTFAILLLFTALNLHAADAPSPEQAKQMLADMHDAFTQFGQLAGGLVAGQQAKADALEKTIADEVNANPALVDENFKPKTIARFGKILTPDQQNVFEAFVNKGRGEANHVLTGLRLKTLSFAIIDNALGGVMPPDLGSIVGPHLKAQDLLIGGSPTHIPADFDKLDAVHQAKWANDHTDFVYLLAGKNVDNLEDGMVIVYVKPEVAGDTNQLVMGDGKIRQVKADQAATVIAELNAGKNPPPSLKGK